MPVYIFQHPETEETKELHQKMSEAHVYKDEDGVEWSRVWTSPNYTIDNKVNPFSSKDFVRKTSKMRGSVGDLWDYSKELSDKRQEIAGRDKIKADHEDQRNESINKRRKVNIKKDIKKAKAAVKRNKKK